MEERYKSFKDFYPFYLSQHQNITCRRLHFAGTALVILTANTLKQFYYLLLTQLDKERYLETLTQIDSILKKFNKTA